MINGGETCLSLPSNPGHLISSWPKTPGSDSDCNCAVIRKFYECECIKRNETVYEVEFRDGSNGSPNQLCWLNLNRNMSGTHFILYRENETIHNTMHRRMYDQSLRITINGQNGKYILNVYHGRF